MTEFATGVEGNLTLDEDYYTLDLSKKALVEKSGKTFYFKLKAREDNVTQIAVESFETINGVGAKRLY